MKKVLFATHNTSKLNLYRNMLEGSNYELIGLDDLDINCDVKEEGNDNKEIAIKKVSEYSKQSKFITISEDTGLYFEGVSEEDQPGVHVNSPKGTILNEEERLDYYVNLIKKYGGTLNGYWTKTVAISSRDGQIFTFDYKIHKIFTDEINENRNPGYPLDSISITPEYNKYTVLLTDEENTKLNDKCNKEIHEFLIKTLDEICQNE